MPTIEAVPATATRRSCAVVWIDEGGATVAATTPDGGFELRTLRPDEAEKWDRSHYLARVVDQVGDRERVLILGPGSLRVELEREYVTIYHRPERLIDVEPADAAELDHLLERLAGLAG